MLSPELVVLLAIIGGHVALNARTFARLASYAAARVLPQPPRLGEEVNEVNRHVEKRLRQKRREAWLGLCKFVSWTAGLGAAWAAMNVLFFNKSSEYSRTRIANYLFYMLCVCAYRYLPGPSLRFGLDRCDLGYAFFMWYTTFLAMMGGCYLDMHLGLTRMAFSAVHRSSRQSVVWGIFHAVCVFFRANIVHTAKRIIGRYELLNDEGMVIVDDPKYVEACWGAMELDMLWDPLFSLCAIVGITMIVEQLATQEAMSTILAQSQGNECKALTSILNATSDAVVRLDGELNVVGPTQKLAAMLDYPTNTLDGVSFKSLLRPESTELRLIEESGDGLFATRIQLEMLDSTGCLVKILCFHARLEELDGSTGHLLGLSEPRVSETDLMIRPPPVARIERVEARGLSAESRSSGMSAGMSSRSSVSSGEGDRMPLVEGHGENSLPVVWLNAEDGLPMVQCTSSFLFIGGPALNLGTPLHEWASTGSNLVQSVQWFVNEHLARVMERSNSDGSLANVFFRHETTATVCPKHLGSRYMATAQVTFVMESLNADDAVEAPSLMRIVFRDIEIVTKSRGGRRGRAQDRVGAASAAVRPASLGVTGQAETPPQPVLIGRVAL